MTDRLRALFKSTPAEDDEDWGRDEDVFGATPSADPSAAGLSPGSRQTGKSPANAPPTVDPVPLVKPAPAGPAVLQPGLIEDPTDRPWQERLRTNLGGRAPTGEHRP